MPPEASDFVDDQFEWRDIRLPGADRARQILDQWEIRSVGKRPIDYMCRDFLISSSLREARMWAMKKFSGSPPVWAGQMTQHLHADMTLRKQAIQIVGISFLHLAHLAGLYEKADDAGRILIDHLGGCWPYGVEVRWTGSSKKKKEEICRKPRQCIFCFARLVCELFHRITAGPLQDRDEQFLILGRLRHIYEEAITGRALRNSIREVKPQLTNRLIHEAKQLGATGGIVTFIVGPCQYATWEGHEVQTDIDGFTFDVSILAAVKSPTSALDALIGGQNDGAIDWCFRHGSEPNALRFFLAGTAVSCRTAFERGGDTGAFFVPPWPLANYEQWSAHYEATKNIHLYDFWGDWQGAVPPTVRTSRLFVNCTGPVRGKIRRSRAFRLANEERSEQATNRRELLLPAAQLIWNQLTLGNTRCGWRSLQHAFAEAGQTVSERDARWLANRLSDDRAGQTTTAGAPS